MPKVKDVMEKFVVTINPEETIYKAAKTMDEKGVGALMIASNDTPVGIVTERDLVRKVIAAKKDSSKKISEVMSRPLITIEPEDDVKEAAKKMLINDVRRLPVVKNGKLMGIITATDLARNLAGQLTEHDSILYAIARYHKYGY